MTIILCVAVVALACACCWMHVRTSSRIEKLEARLEDAEWEHVTLKD